MNALMSNLGICDGAHWLVVMKNPRGSKPSIQYSVAGIQFVLRAVSVLQKFSCMHYTVVHEDRSLQLASVGRTQVGPGAGSAPAQSAGFVGAGDRRPRLAEEGRCGRSEDEAQRGLQTAAAGCFGVLASGNPRRAETARAALRKRLRRRYAR